MIQSEPVSGPPRWSQGRGKGLVPSRWQATMARWLMDPGVDSAERAKRGAIAQLEDWRQRRSFESSIGATNSQFTGDARSGAHRYTEHLAAMRREQVVPRPRDGKKEHVPRPPEASSLSEAYGPGEWAYRVLSGFAHRSAWTGMLMDHQAVADSPTLPGSQAVKVVADWKWTLRMTAAVAGVVEAGVQEAETYFGVTVGSEVRPRRTSRGPAW